MEEVKIIASDGFSLAGAFFDVENPKAIVQVVHGAKEHKERYYDFIEFLNENGYAVLIKDHRGHGHSTDDDYPLGYMDDLAQMIDDVYQGTKWIKGKYPNLPFYMLGHSMGSLFARAYMEEHDDELDKLVLSGTVNYKLAVHFAMFMSKIYIKKDGLKGKSAWMIKMGDNDDDDWVCSDPKVMDAYHQDPYCAQYKYTNAAIRTLWDGDRELGKLKKYQCKNLSLPILCIAGELDPVTGFKKGLKDSKKKMNKLGYQNYREIVYPNMKHEVLNEIGKEKVYEDVLAFFSEKE